MTNLTRLFMILGIAAVYTWAQQPPISLPRPPLGAGPFIFATAEQPNKPARSAVQVAALVAPGALVEIEVIAVRPHKPEAHPGKTHKGS